MSSSAIVRQPPISPLTSGFWAGDAPVFGLEMHPLTSWAPLRSPASQAQNGAPAGSVSTAMRPAGRTSNGAARTPPPALLTLAAASSARDVRRCSPWPRRRRRCQPRRTSARRGRRSPPPLAASSRPRRRGLAAAPRSSTGRAARPESAQGPRTPTRTALRSLVGERWALPIVRELPLGPKRFTDLRSGLPHLSADVLSQRLRELERDGIVTRGKLPPPAGSRICELTDQGRALEPALLALGRWGSRAAVPADADELGVDSTIVALKTLFDPRRADRLQARYELRLGEHRFDARVGCRSLAARRRGRTRSSRPSRKR